MNRISVDLAMHPATEDQAHVCPAKQAGLRTRAMLPDSPRESAAAAVLRFRRARSGLHTEAPVSHEGVGEGWPNEALARRAWVSSRYARWPCRLPADWLSLGLHYTLSTGNIPVDRGDTNGGEVLHVARLVAALEVKLMRCEIGETSLGRLRRLVPLLPEPWQSRLRRRLN